MQCKFVIVPFLSAIRRYCKIIHHCSLKLFCLSSWFTLLESRQTLLFNHDAHLPLYTKLLQCVWLFATLWTIAHSPPSSSVHGIFLARILERVVLSFSRGSSWPRDQIQVSCVAGRFLTIWASRETPRYIKRSSNSCFLRFCICP